MKTMPPPASFSSAPAALVTDPAELLVYEIDAGLDRGRPDAVAFPRSAADVAALVGWAAAQGLPIVARGAGTGLSGGAVPEHGGVIVQFSHMTGLLHVSEAGRSATVQPGMVNLALDKQMKARGLYYPPDPSSGRSATIGGNIAENSGGPHCFKYGVTTNYVAGLEVVLADGRLVQLGGRALDYPEYDLCGLVSGSEGTLAIVTAAHLRLLRNPPAVKTLMAAFATVEAAGEAVSAVIAAGLMPSTLEMMDQRMMTIIEQFTHAGLPIQAGAALIVEADGYPSSVGPQIDEIERILQAHGAFDMRIAQNDAERELIWYGRKNAVGAMTRLAPSYYLVDVTVPRSKLAATLHGVNEICEGLGLRVGYVFHAGDGNLHPLILIENPADQELMARVHRAGRAIVQLCVGFDGSITGEHGVGIEKREYMPLMYSRHELDVMRDVKAVFDPHERLNPGKIFPPATPDSIVEKEPSDQRSAPLAHALPSAVAPASPQAAADLLRRCAAAGTTVRIDAGGTHTPGRPRADLLLSTEHLRGIRAYARDDMYVTVGAGTPLAELQAELAPDRMWVPIVAPDPAATIGGIVSANANAPLRMRYGGLRDLVLAATVALPDGRLIRAGRPVVKNVAGYDLPKLFIGARGTLGLLCDLTLKLAPQPRERASLVVPVPDLAHGLAWGAQLLPVCLVASALLLCEARALGGTPLDTPYALVYTAEGPAIDVAAELAQVREQLRAAGAGAPIAAPELAGSTCWAEWLRGANAAARAGADRLSLRVGVPPEHLPALVSTHAGQHACLVDLPNGMLYLEGLLDGASIAAQAQALGGYSLVLAGTAAEELRWAHTPAARDLMRALHARWNPGGRLNPGAMGSFGDSLKFGDVG